MRGSQEIEVEEVEKIGSAGGGVQLTVAGKKEAAKLERETAEEESKRQAKGPGEEFKMLEKQVDKTSVYLVLLSVVVDILGVAMVVPILPFYATEKFGASSTQLGVLYSAFSATATVSTLIMGWLSDKFGRKNLLVVSLFGSCSGFLFHAFADSYDMLLAARLYTGVFASSTTVAQAYIADTIPGPLQPKYMANLGGAVGLAFMIGPTIGGAIAAAANNDYRYVYYVGAIVAGFGMIYTMVRLKDSKGPKEKDDGNGSGPVVDPKIEALLERKILSIPVLTLKLGVIRFLNQLGWNAYTSMFTLFMIDKYRVSSVLVGTQTLGGSAFYVLCTTFLFKRLVARMGLTKTVGLGQILMCLALIIIPLWGKSQAEQWMSFFTVWTLLLTGFGLYMPGITSMIAKYTLPGSRGKILGCATMFMSAGDIVGPILFGAVYDLDSEHRTLWFIGAGGVLFAIILLQLIVRCYIDVEVDVPDRERSASVDGDEDWEWHPDRKATDEDYLRLGKMVGDSFTKKRWRWVSRAERFVPFLVDLLQPIPDQAIKTRKAWEDWWQFNEFFRHRVNEVKVEADEANRLLGDLGYDYQNELLTMYSVHASGL